MSKTIKIVTVFALALALAGASRTTTPERVIVSACCGGPICPPGSVCPIKR